MSSKYTKGSLWRRWDLHIHSPCSVLHNEFSGWENYSKALNEADQRICAIGITDYATIDGYKKVYREKIDNGSLSNFDLIIPNIEFRILPYTKQGSGINIHILINVQDPDHIAKIEDALSRLTFEYNSVPYPCATNGFINLGKTQVGNDADKKAAFKEGINQFKPDFQTFKKWYESEGWLNDNSLIAVSNSSNDGVSGLKHEDGFKAVRQQIYRFSDIVFSGNPNDRDYFLGKGTDSEQQLIETINGIKPCIHGSDAHNKDKLFNPDEDRYFWIKADPTFEGLRQILYEPEARVYIGKTIPDSRDENRIISTISIINSNGWFEDVELPVNDALVSIIGCKGSGKTALTDLIAYATCSWEDNKDSFLFKANKEIIGTQITVNWKNGVTDTAEITNKLNQGVDKKVRYLSQHMVEKLCSEDFIGAELVKEIEKVIFEYLDDTEKLGKTTFYDLRTAKTEGIRKQKIRIRAAIINLNEEIQILNGEISSRQLKEDKINDLEVEKKGLEGQKPKFESDEEQKIEDKLSELRKLRQTIIEKISDQKQLLETISNIQHKIKSFTDDMDEFYNSLCEDLKVIGLSEDDLNSFRPQFQGDIESPINKQKKIIEEKISINEGVTDDLYSVKKTKVSIEKKIKELEEKSSADNAKKQKSIEVQKRINSIDTDIKKLKHEINAIDTIKSKQLNEKIEERWRKYLSYFDNLLEEQKVLEKLYESLSKVLGRGSDEEKSIEFFIKWSAGVESWALQGETLIDQRKQGIYRAKGDISDKAKELIEQHWMSGVNDNIKKALQDFRETFDDKEKKYNLKSQLLNDVTEAKFDDWLFDTEHIRLHYGIKYDGVELENLSPGTKGIVLLIIYLEMDKDDRRPLLIDQPEENLDNESVYKVLTKYFRRAKQRRQIILITHNPNLVVNTDSEQIIVASFTKNPADSNAKIKYTMGSLEHSQKDPAGIDLGTRERVCEILEGGETAFHMREKKYAFSKA